jgi:HD-GYP domain-containing protein (c-di-GMP phosphodiesterase class II)
MTMTMAEIDRYIPVSPTTICPSEVTDFPIFVRDDLETPIRLYRDVDNPFEADDLQRLIDGGVKKLYITLDDHDRYQRYLRKNFVAILSDEGLPIEHRLNCLNEFVRNVLAEAFTRRDMANTVETAKLIAFQTVELICQGEIIAAELLRVLHHDYHTFTHSANVAYYCVLLAKASGITDHDDLRQVATGALLHDIGKLNIPETILKKRGRLDDDEWDVIKRHPTNGMRLLLHRDDMTFAQLMMVYQHHERLDGSGYPVGVTTRRIHPWAQLCAIVDVYEALTSCRPYRPGLPPEEAIAILDRQAGVRLNRGLWQCWKTIIQNV